jgi:hypothetical protein
MSPASVNRELATLRRLLRLAQEWKVLDRVPRIRLLRGERNREFVLSHRLEPTYLRGMPAAYGRTCTSCQPFMELGYIAICGGKSKSAKRNLSLTSRAALVLKARKASVNSPYVCFRGIRPSGQSSLVP